MHCDPAIPIGSSSGQTEPIVIVPVVPIVPVPIGDPAIVIIVVPRAAAQNGNWRHSRHKDHFFSKKFRLRRSKKKKSRCAAKEKGQRVKG
jgi:hypothetical protein